MKKLMDNEILSFVDNSQMKTYFKEQVVSDRWVNVYTNELETVPLEHNELNLLVPGSFLFTTKKGLVVNGFSADVENEDITTSMKNTRIAICLPYNDTMVLYPLRYTAFSHIQERSGISGSSISSLKERRRANEMAPDTRCKCINEGLDLYKDKTLVLIRDGKCTALLSGDESDYSVMPTSELISILENELKNSYAGYEYAMSRTSHEITEVLYNLKDRELEKRVFDVLTANGELVSNISLQVRLTTSDVGKCAARLTPIIYDEGKPIILGKSLSVEHKGGKKAMKAFEDITQRFLAKYRENITNLQKMMNITIHYPADCLKNIYTALKMTGHIAALRNCQERIVAEHNGTCSAYDIYWYLNEMLYMSEISNKQQGKTVSLFESIKAQETVAEILFMDITQYDHPSE